MKMIVNHMDDDMKNKLKERGKNCYKWRIENGVTKKQMADWLGCSLPTVTKIEATGIMRIEIIEKLKRLNSGVGVQPRDFLQ